MTDTPDLRRQRAKLPIERPCSACSAGDYDMQHHDHAPPFSEPALPELLETAKDHGAQPEPDALRQAAFNPPANCICDYGYATTCPVHSNPHQVKLVTPALRSDKDYAIEHGGYLADAAQAYLDERNRFDAASESGSEEVQDSDSLSDHFSALRDAIYEFRKRARRVTGNEGKDGRDNFVGNIRSDSSVVPGETASQVNEAPLASPAVVTQDSKIRGLILYLQSDFADQDDKERPLDQRWINIGPGTLAKILERFAKAKVSGLEAQLQQARAVIDNKTGIIEALCRGGKAELKALRELRSAELERMRAGGKQ